MLYITSLSYIDFVPYFLFKTKHNLYLNEHGRKTVLVKSTSWIRFPTKVYDKSSMFASRHACIYFGKKTCGHLRC